MSFIEKALKKVSALDKGATHPDTQGNIVQPRQRNEKTDADITDYNSAKAVDAPTP